MYIAVMDWTTENRIAKYQDFKAKADAQTHVRGLKRRYPHAFVAAQPAGGFADWLVDPTGPTLSLSPRPAPPSPPSSDASVVIRALLDKGTITTTELDAARERLGG